MSFPEVLAVASRNEHKLREIARICPDWPVRWLTALDAGAPEWPDVEEHGGGLRVAAGPERGGAVGRRLHPEAVPAQEVRHRLPDVRFVVGHDHEGLLVHG